MKRKFFEELAFYGRSNDNVVNGCWNGGVELGTCIK